MTQSIQANEDSFSQLLVLWARLSPRESFLDTQIRATQPRANAEALNQRQAMERVVNAAPRPKSESAAGYLGHATIFGLGFRALNSPIKRRVAMARNFINPSPTGTPLISCIGGRLKFYKYAGPWRSARSDMDRTKIRSIAGSFAHVKIPEQKAVFINLGCRNPLIIQSGPVGEAQLDDQA